MGTLRNSLGTNRWADLVDFDNLLVSSGAQYVWGTIVGPLNVRSPILHHKFKLYILFFLIFIPLYLCVPNKHFHFVIRQVFLFA